MIISEGRLIGLAEAVFVAAGSSAEEARKVAHRLVEANMAGHDSHGVGMIPAYVDSVLAGRLKPNQEPRILRDNGAVLVIDGQVGYGQVIAERAMRLGIEKARQLGIAAVALRNSHHIGRVGAWGEMCAAAGFVSMHWVNAFARAPLVAPYGGADARFTTDPYCTAIPATASNPPIILDMATSKIAMGKVRVARNTGTQVPPDALIDAHGNPTRDPEVMYQDPPGALMSMGLYKGYGLAVICEMLAGALGGGGAFSMARIDENTIINNMLTVILDPELFGEIDRFHDEIDRFTAHVKASPVAPWAEEVMVPGDPERRMRAEREREGVPLDDTTWREIVAAAGRIGLSPQELDRLAGN